MHDPISMKFHLMMGLNNDISKIIFHENFKSLDDNYIGALKAEQELMKAKASRSQAHFSKTKLQGSEHEDSTTKMSKPDELQGNTPMFDFTTIPFCSIDDAEYFDYFSRRCSDDYDYGASQGTCFGGE